MADSGKFPFSVKKDNKVLRERKRHTDHLTILNEQQKGQMWTDKQSENITLRLVLRTRSEKLVNM